MAETLPERTMEPEARNDAAFGVYVHWPYCARICPYCDFNVYKARAVDAGRWTAALTRDLRYWRERADGAPLTSLYFGGGTPSLAPPETIAAIIDACADLWGFADDPEITLEANPAEAGLLADFARAGVNRLSLGVQSFDEAALKFLGRDHTAVEARAAVELALNAFPRASFDLIYARPGQTNDQWREELGRALDLGATHLSLYQLTIEPGTAFERAVSAGRWAPSADDAAAAQYEIAQETTAARGLPAYEISNHAAPGAQSRHNLIYWRGGDYIGVGPGAHGRVPINGVRRATKSHDRPQAYLDAVAATGTGAESVEVLSPAEARVERFIMGLRLREGFDLAPDDPLLVDPAAKDRLADLQAEGFARLDGARLRATPSGRLVLNRILYKLLG